MEPNKSAPDWRIRIDRQDRDFFASLPFRQVSTQRPTEAEASGALVQYYSELARSGAFNPNDPHRVGATPIQHAIEILTEQLTDHIARRFTEHQDGVRDHEICARANEEDTSAGAVWTRDGRFTRRNDIISGIATAIAALARVKEL